MMAKCPKCEYNNVSDSKFCKECGTQLVYTEGLPTAPTETLDTPIRKIKRGSIFAHRYEIIEELGQGGMGKVYRVYDKKIEGEVALKLIKPEIVSDKTAIDRFRNELKISREITHRNVCRMYDLNEEKGTYYITMEYITGENLKSLIRRVRQLTIGTAVSIAKQICVGLAEAHRLGIVHRDMKPSNIMIDKDGNARIMDFGIARSLESKGITGARVSVGTPEYMSPEQAEGKKTDERSDIYSSGIILFEMLTGRLPFESETPLSMAIKHKTEQPPNPKEFNSQIPDDLSRLILGCLEKNKEIRYQSAEEVLSDLEKIEEEIPITKGEIPRRKTTTPKEITVTLSLKKFIYPALAIIALIVIAVLVWQLFIKEKPISPLLDKPSVAVLPFTDLSPEKDQGYLCEGLAESIINALAKSKDLLIPARTASFAIKDKTLEIQEIGKRLNVQAILEGSIQKSKDKVMISAQLINVPDGMLLWAEQYHQDLEDIFTIQSEVSLKIAEQLEINLLALEKGSPNKRALENRYKVR
ncbi:MAG: protein kinase [Candidatus Aminicenantes bacterium]|nr:MAG: protein kinase [Candidatus Aminicenantes bacterium]